MFQEPYLNSRKTGWIEVISGPMFSGKTEELIRRIKRVEIAKIPTLIFKPTIDQRYSENDIVSHNETSLSAIKIDKSIQILDFIQPENQVIGIDEVQFMDHALIEIVEGLALKGIRIIVAGLDMNYKGKPFGIMPDLLAIAEYVTKVHAICQQCGNLATHTYKKPSTILDEIEIGAKDKYEPRCRKCYHMGNVLELGAS